MSRAIIYTCERCGAQAVHSDDSSYCPKCESADRRQFRKGAALYAQAAAYREARRAKRTLFADELSHA